MLSRPLIGALVLALGGNLALGYLWRDARDTAAQADREAAVLRSNLEAAVESERVSRRLAEVADNTLAEWQAERRAIESELSATRRAVDQIRAQAREETDDASLACAVLPVPGAVDRLLRSPEPGRD